MDEHRHENQPLEPSGSYHGTVGVFVWLPGSLGVWHMLFLTHIVTQGRLRNPWYGTFGEQSRGLTALVAATARLSSGTESTHSP